MVNLLNYQGLFEQQSDMHVLAQGFGHVFYVILLTTDGGKNILWRFTFERRLQLKLPRQVFVGV